MPPVAKLTIAYGAGLWAGLVFLVPSRGLSLILPVIALASAWVASGGAVTAPRPTGRAPYLVTALLAGATVALGVLTSQHQDCATQWMPGPHAAIIQLHDRPSRKGLTSGTVAYATERCGGDLLFRFDSAGAARGGARLLVAGVYRGSGVLHVVTGRELRSVRSWRYRLRDAIGARIDRRYGPRAPLVEALVTGRREDLDRGLQNDFAASGLAHLLSISGLHVGILAAWLVMVLKRVVPRRPVLGISTAISWGYVILLGCPAPATRTVGFITVHAVSRWWQRHPPGSAVLATSVLLIIAIDPTAALSIGAWLSVAAVWGTAAATRALPPRWRQSAVPQLVAASVGATLLTAPISAYAFGSIAPIGIVANLVAVPLSGIAVPAVFLSLFAGSWLAAGSGLALAGIERTAALAARVPLGHYSGEPGAGFALPWGVLLVAALWIRRHPPRVSRYGGRVAWASAVMACVAAFAWGIPVSGHAPVEIHVLDVGQGDAIAVRSPAGHWLLVDAGPRTPASDAGRTVVLPFFRKQGVATLDVLVATHADADHLGGVPAVLRELNPRLVLENGQPVGTNLFLEHLGVVDSRGITWKAARAGDTLVLDSLVISVLHPTSQWIAANQETNENSVVLRLSYGQFDAILTGDMGLPVESFLSRQVLPAEVLKVGHHGSAGSTGEEWLAAVHPEVAVISVGAGNRYGHPAPAALGRLAHAGAAVWRTDRGGTVTIRTDGRTFWVEQSHRLTFTERIQCLRATWLPSSASSSSKNDCTAVRRVNYPTFSTTSPSPRR